MIFPHEISPKKKLPVNQIYYHPLHASFFFLTSLHTLPENRQFVIYIFFCQRLVLFTLPPHIFNMAQKLKDNTKTSQNRTYSYEYPWFSSYKSALGRSFVFFVQIQLKNTDLLLRLLSSQESPLLFKKCAEGDELKQRLETCGNINLAHDWLIRPEETNQDEETNQLQVC